MRYADVILPLALPRNYTYAVPEELQGQLLPGHRVAVQFGARRKYAAIVSRLHDEPPAAYQTKPLLYRLDKDIVVHPPQLAFWRWLATYYMCTEGEVMSAALPTHLKLTSETRLVFNEAYGEDFGDLDEEEYLVAEALHLRRELSLDEVQKLLDKVRVYEIVQRLLEKKVCHVQEELKEAYRPRQEKFVRLHPRYAGEQALAAAFELVRRSPKQEQALLAFIHLSRTEGEVRRTALLEKAGVSAAVLKGLCDKEILEVYSQAVDRLPMGAAAEISAGFELTGPQQKACEAIKEHFRHTPTVLLHGVTSSGKTMIYVRLIEEAIASGRQVLYLLPEIALTTQIVRRLQQYFSGRIGIYHSRFSNNERVEIWNKVRDGEYRIVLGARSSLLLPFRDLGLIILDEEHDASYKQHETAPRYHARDAAIYYAGLFGARVLLGSATPSLESYYNALQGKYGLVSLQGRFGGMEMPDITIADMAREQQRKTATGHFSSLLKEALGQTLDAGKQAILFQNRRGFAPMTVCKACGWVPRCTECDVSLTYHKFHHRLHCHYCGRQYAVPEQCAACGSTGMTHRSFGTERVEDELSALFPKARIARMDLDSVRNKEAHHQLITRFEQRRIDLLVGTQMVVKGLDFDHVNLVGILSADNLMSYPDFRVHERAFQLMEQVSGRAGRRGQRGRVIIQTMRVAHPLLDFVVRHDYEGFYRSEISERERFGYPPFTRLIRITLRHRRQPVVMEAARLLEEGLRPRLGDRLLGPAAPPVGRVRGQYLMELLVKIPREGGAVGSVKRLLLDNFARLQAHADLRRVGIIPDVDAV